MTMDCLLGIHLIKTQGPYRPAKAGAVGGEYNGVSNRQSMKVTNLGSLTMGYHQRACRKVDPKVRKVHQQTVRTDFQKDYKSSGHNGPFRIPGLFVVRSNRFNFMYAFRCSLYTLPYIFAYDP